VDHPTLNEVEKLIVDDVRGRAAEHLAQLHPARAPEVAYAIAAELADYVLQQYNRNLRPAPSGLCGIKVRRGGNVLHCKLATGHPGPCCHD
jgi:hypothetical protein